MATLQIQIDASYLPINICRLCSGMKKFGGYSIGLAQIDEIKEKLNFWNCPTSTIRVLVSKSDMSDMRCFSLGEKSA